MVNSVIVNDLKNDTFFARVILDSDGKMVEVDSRPSDALALAVRTNVPIFADESVLDKAGIMLDGETGKPIFDEKEETDAKTARSTMKSSARRCRHLGLINTLDLDDFDKRKSSALNKRNPGPGPTAGLSFLLDY